MLLGFHVSKTVSAVSGRKKNRRMAQALSEDMQVLSDYGFKTPCAQIFVSGPQSFDPTLDDADKIEVRRLVDETGLVLVIHGAYIDHPWGRSAGSIENIRRELKVASEIGATGVIVHLSAGTFVDEALAFVLDKLGADCPPNTTLWLEINTAKPSKYTYETPEKLRVLFERVMRANVHAMSIGLCIDTAHLFSCGVALLAREDAVSWLGAIDELAKQVPVMIHLNDSMSTLASGKDKHAPLTQGNLWGVYRADGGLPIEDSGLASILTWADKRGIVVILERDPALLEGDLRLVRDMGFR